jgi:protein-disulfide isomerase
MSKKKRKNTPQKETKKPAANRSVMFVAAAVGLLLIFIAAKSFYTSSEREQAAEAAPAVMAMLDRPHAMTLGPADAPVVIVEFFDPACETCAAFYPMVKQLMDENAGKIRLVLRYAPFHPGSDSVVAALEAARRQDKFWPALEALLASQAGWAPNHTSQMGLAWPYLEGLGLDLAQMRQDMISPEVSQIISQDLADARALNVTKTPEYFVNGRPLPSFGWTQLTTLVDEALAQAR